MHELYCTSKDRFKLGSQDRKSLTWINFTPETFWLRKAKTKSIFKVRKVKGFFLPNDIDDIKKNRHAGRVQILEIILWSLKLIIQRLRITGFKILKVVSDLSSYLGNGKAGSWMSNVESKANVAHLQLKLNTALITLINNTVFNR